MFIVRDYAKKLQVKCGCKSDVLSALITFSGLFGCRKEDIRIEDCKNGIEMTYEEFYKTKVQQ